MDNITIILQKILFVLALILAGGIARHMRLVSDEGEKDLSKLVVDFFWPALTFSSIIANLNRDGLVRNWVLPISAVVTALVGLGIGWLVCRFLGYQKERRSVFLYHAMVCNFVFMVLPFCDLLLPGTGRALLFVHNLGYTLVIWTLGVMLFAGYVGWRESLRNLLSPALIATMAAILLVLLNWTRFVPTFAVESIDTLGKPCLAVAMMLAGSQLYKMGRHALKFDGWNIWVGLVRLVLTPALLFGLTLLLRQTGIPREALIVFMLVNIMPVSVNSVSLAMRYGSSAELAAQGVLFTHLWSVPTVLMFILLIERWV